MNKIKSRPVGDFGIHRIVSRLNHKGISENEKNLAAASTSFDRLQVRHTVRAQKKHVHFYFFVYIQIINKKLFLFSNYTLITLLDMQNDCRR